MAKKGSLFGTAGVRGRYGEEITTDLALRFGLALTARLAAHELIGPVVIGWDVRLTSSLLASALASGVLQAGVSAYWLGLASFPGTAKATMESAVAGAYVTASHNPPEYNGLKLFDEEGSEVTREEEQELERTVLSDAKHASDLPGELLEPEYCEDDYINDLLGSIDIGEVKGTVIVDPANGAACWLGPEAVRAVCRDVVAINSHPDGRFPSRIPEPSRKNLGDLMRLVKGLGAELGIAWDGDADRVAVVDPSGGFVPQYKVSGLIAKVLKAKKAIVSVDMGLGFKDAVKGEVLEWRLGDLHSAYKKRRESGWKAQIFTEPWKIADTNWGPFFDGIRATLLFLKGVEEFGGLKEALDQVPTYAQTRISMLCPNSMKVHAAKRLARHLKEALGGEVIGETRIDGMKLKLEDGWVLIRPSGTEPKVRIYVESAEESQTQRLRALSLRFARDLGVCT